MTNMKTFPANSPATPPNRLTRRQALKLIGVTGVGLALPEILPAASSMAATSVVPTPGSVWVISSPVTLDADATVAGVVVQPGGTLTFDPAKSVTLLSTGNVVVQGRLTMKPATAAAVHKILFPSVKESSFVGGGMVPLDSDVGLWVTGSGVLDIVGTSKLTWTRASGSVVKGAKTIQLFASPTGWRVGDEVVVTPTLPPTVLGHYQAYETATVTAISGNTITLSAATVYDHPAVTVGAGQTYAAEVLNVTRNVRIEGTSAGRTHVWISSSAVQTIRYAAMRYVGPRKKGTTFTDPVPGRYGVHFHHCMDGSNGSLVEGVVVRDGGNHAFVPHMSDGVTFRDCISHNTYEQAYWWDTGDESNGTTWDRCVASQILSDPPFRGYSLAGFTLGAGTNNTVRGCVATGVRGNASANGFHWPPEIAAGVWASEDCVAHNNAVHGIYAWQNDHDPHLILRFVGYHNGQAGTLHGAYVNSYVYQDCIFYGNSAGGLKLAAESNGNMRFVNVWFDGGGITDHAMVNDRHTATTPTPVVFDRCTFRGGRRSGVGLTREGTNAELLDFVNCTWVGNEYWLASGIHTDSKLRVQDSVHGSISLQRADRSGTYNAAWNARVNAIAPFA
ncbi:MAG: hypothetical protein ACT4PO_01605 [Actinomycetota bacterium]